MKTEANTPAHTPGPWEVYAVVPNSPLLITSRTGVVATPNRDMRAMVANARLIAAAPELLAACKAALARIENASCGELTAAELRETAGELRAAIAAAETTQL